MNDTWEHEREIREKVANELLEYATYMLDTGDVGDGEYTLDPKILRIIFMAWKRAARFVRNNRGYAPIDFENESWIKEPNENH